MTRRVLILTYEFPPSGGGGVQRVAKFARYLRDNGWEPVVVTARAIAGRSRDESLARELEGVEVVRTPARHVSSAIARVISPVKALLKRGRGAGPAAAGATGLRPTVSNRLARHLTLDDAQLWVGPASRAAVRIGRERGVEAVIASGPPFSVTWAGVRAARSLGVPLIVDLRDAWRDNPVAWFPDAESRRRSEDLERLVLGAAAVVTATTPTIVAEAREMGGRDVRHLPNGYDAADVVPWAPSADGPLRLTFMGKMYRGHSEPDALFTALARLRALRPDLEVRFEVIGDPLEDVARAAAQAGLQDAVTFAGYLPHREAIARLASADVAVSLIADRPGATGAIGGKVFEYLGVGIPVLVVGPLAGETASLVSRAHAGWALTPSDTDGLVALLADLADRKRSGAGLGVTPDSAVVESFDRRAQAAALAGILGEVTAS
jgi:glycosyltransferase involved in cell wall biosynthesis